MPGTMLAQQAPAIMQASCSSRVQTQAVAAPCRFMAAPSAAANLLPSRPLIARRQQQRQQRRLVCAAAAAEGVGKLISKVEIPAFIPRQDLMDQLTRWALIEIQENGIANVGVPCKVTPFRREGELWGFTVSFLKDGVSATDVRVAFDEEVTHKYEWVGRGAAVWESFGGKPVAEQNLELYGFPALEGNSQEVLGKNFEIRKVDDKPVSENVRSGIRDFCQMLVSAINKYYAFGSAFVDDST